MSKKGKETERKNVVDKGISLFEPICDADKEHLLRLQWLKAEQGDTRMLIWLGKQYLNQKDSILDMNVKPIDEIDFNGI